ncbi:MAG: hypothetical protein GTO02_14645, partial [Candidatus Dadabacteria bacterium]|nr:hypothetical protein [Candidatus Dadabacteria bacterium]
MSDELFLKGQLNISRQVRKQPHLQYKFNITYDSYLIDRPENRLLKLALEHVGHLVKLPKNQRLVRELLFHFD